MLPLGRGLLLAVRPCCKAAVSRKCRTAPQSVPYAGRPRCRRRAATTSRPWWQPPPPLPPRRRQAPRPCRTLPSSAGTPSLRRAAKAMAVSRRRVRRRRVATPQLTPSWRWRSRPQRRRRRRRSCSDRHLPPRRQTRRGKGEPPCSHLMQSFISIDLPSPRPIAQVLLAAACICARGTASLHLPCTQTRIVSLPQAAGVVAGEGQATADAGRQDGCISAARQRRRGLLGTGDAAASPVMQACIVQRMGAAYRCVAKRVATLRASCDATRAFEHDHLNARQTLCWKSGRQTL